MRDIKTITKQLNKFLETQIEEDAIEMIKAGTYEGDDIDKIVLENIDEFSVNDLVRILDNYDWYVHNGVYKLYPSGFWYASLNGNQLVTKYPVKLAEAMTKINDSETITDLYNIFYRQRSDLKTWGDAAQVWMNKILSDPDKEVIRAFDWAEGDEGYDYLSEIFDTIRETYPKFIMKVLRKLSDNDAENILDRMS